MNEILNVNDYFYDKFEIPWRKLINYIFKQYTDGMISEDMLNEFLIKYKIKWLFLILMLMNKKSFGLGYGIRNSFLLVYTNIAKAI